MIKFFLLILFFNILNCSNKKTYPIKYREKLKPFKVSIEEATNETVNFFDTKILPEFDIWKGESNRRTI